MSGIRDGILPFHFRLELLASLERLLCFCHTGNTVVFTTSLMNPLGLSRGALKDGFPMLQNIFTKPTILTAMKNGFDIDPRRWPKKDGHPAMSSKRAQVLTYSLGYFMVRLSSISLFNIAVYSSADRNRFYPRQVYRICSGADRNIVYPRYNISCTYGADGKRFYPRRFFLPSLLCSVTV